MKKIKKAFYILTAVILSFLLTIVCINAIVIGKTKGSVSLDTKGDIPSSDYILVLGCGLKPDGTPSDMLADRVKTSVMLYELGVSEYIIMSGDHTDSYNEVGAMREYAMSLGVPSESILCDPEGFSTYESVYRAKEEFKTEKVIIVTQEYHLYRALYIAQKFGMEAHGVSADVREYRGQILRDMREVVARTKDFFFALVKPKLQR